MGLFSKKKSEVNEISIPEIRESLRRDRVLLLSVIAEVIRKHWSVLEDKLEQHTHEDDYGNISVHDDFRRELVYFSEKVVLPVLEKEIENNKTTNRNVTLILSDVIKLGDRGVPDGVGYSDSNRAIADKIQASIEGSLLDDEVLYKMYASQDVMNYWVNGAYETFMQNPLMTLHFKERLEASQPIAVTPYVWLVSGLIFAMHNSKSYGAPKNQRTAATFMGNDPYKYEEFINRLLRDNGFSSKRTRGSGDYGVDVLAAKNGKTFAIQCKLYNHPVGTKSVQEVIGGRIFYKTDYAVVVSDNSFTDAAKLMARKTGVKLSHHTKLLHRLEELITNKDQVDDISGKQKGAEDTHAPDAVEQQQVTDDELIAVVLPTINNDRES